MDTPTVAEIRALSPQDQAALNRQLTRTIAKHMLGMMFVKLSLTSVLTVLAKKALIEAAKRS